MATTTADEKLEEKGKGQGERERERERARGNGKTRILEDLKLETWNLKPET
jgi:hypothetical protein